MQLLVENTTTSASPIMTTTTTCESDVTTMDQDETTMPVSEVKADIEVFDIDEEDDEEMPAAKTTTATPEVPTAQLATLEVGTGTTGSATPPTEEKVEAKDNMSKIDNIIDTARSIINPETGEVEMRDFEQEEVEKMLKKIGKAELEDIILKKIVEAVNAHTVVGHLRAKCLHLHGLKDKLFQKSGVLQKQVTELSKALKVYQENANRSPSQQKPPPPLKFYRSVGLQVNVETSTTRSPMPRVNNTPRMTNSNATAFMQQISNGPLSSSTPNTNSPNNNNILSPPNGGMKRVNKPTITVAELRNQVGRPEQPKMARNNSNTAMAAPRQHQAIMPMPRNPAAGAAINALNAATAANQGKKGTTSGLIDLTEDNNNGGGLVLNQNGLQYRVLNQAGIPQGMQLVSSSAGYHLVSPQGQSRPVVFQQAGTGRQISPSQAQTTAAFHGINRPAIMQQQQQQQQQRTIPPPNRVVTTRAPVPNQMMNGNHHQVGQHGMLGQKPPQVTPPRSFALPMLPAPTTPMVQQRAKATKDKPPQPELTLQEQDGGIVLSWTHKIGQNHAEISSYQIFACQQPLNPNGNVIAPAWKRVGDVKALPLPMACTLSQFSDENRYHFIVRGLDVYNRSGPFCEIVSIVLRKKR